MASISDLLSNEQTIFSNSGALDPDFIPKILPHREGQQKQIIVNIKPMLASQNGRHTIIRGVSGVGKTAVVKRILMDLEENTDGIVSIYANCWTKNTTYKIITELVQKLGYKFTYNMSTDELYRKAEEIFSKQKSIVFVFDEVDKVDDHDFLYFLLEAPVKKTIIMITSDYGWSTELDARIISRLLPDTVTFEPYNPIETANILQERVKYAFYQNVWDFDAFNKIANYASKFNDIRVGVMLLKAAGMAAENDSSKKILEKHTDLAISSTDGEKVRTSNELTEDEREVLSLCEGNCGALLNDLYNMYQGKGGEKSERTFRRRLGRLASRGFIDLQTVPGQGQGTKVIYKGSPKTLQDFVQASD